MKKKQLSKIITHIPNFPRRSVYEEMSVEEQKIFDLVQDIEKLGASLALTKAVILLSEARDALADHIEGIE